jgi:hypothetical protein
MATEPLPLIRFESENTPRLNRYELAMILELAKRRPKDDLRVVTDDGNNNIKVYVGPVYFETDRYWVHPDGTIGIHEKEHNFEDGGDWRVT